MPNLRTCRGPLLPRHNGVFFRRLCGNKAFQQIISELHIEAQNARERSSPPDSWAIWSETNYGKLLRLCHSDWSLSDIRPADVVKGPEKTIFTINSSSRKRGAGKDTLPFFCCQKTKKKLLLLLTWSSRKFMMSRIPPCISQDWRMAIKVWLSHTCSELMKQTAKLVRGAIVVIYFYCLYLFFFFTPKFVRNNPNISLLISYSPPHRQKATKNTCKGLHSSNFNLTRRPCSSSVMPKLRF